MIEPLLDGGDASAKTMSEKEASTITSQFSYTYKFRSLKGATEYHNEHIDADHLPGHHAVHGQEKEDSKTADRPSTVLLPGT